MVYAQENKSWKIKGRTLPHISGNCKLKGSFWKLGMKGSVKGTSPTHGNAKSTQELLLLFFRNNPRWPPWPVYPSSLLLSQKGKKKKISTRIQTSLFSGCQITIALGLILITLLWVWGDTETLLFIVNLVSIPESPWGALCFVCVCVCMCVC